MTQYILITGASKGFGRELAIYLAQSKLVTDHPTHMILCARNHIELEEVKQTILRNHTSPNTLLVIIHTVDFSRLNLEAIGNQLLYGVVPASNHTYTKAFLFNNAGSLGKLQRGRNLDFKDVQDAIHVNVTAPMVLTTKFLKAFNGQYQKATIVNVSSLAALEPFDCWSLYCTGKAARDMFHRCIAIEEDLIQREEPNDFLSAAPSTENIHHSSSNFTNHTMDFTSNNLSSGVNHHSNSAHSSGPLNQTTNVSSNANNNMNTNQRNLSNIVTAVTSAETAAAAMTYNTTSANTPKAPSRVRVLNYAPGPLNTDMQTQIRNDMPPVPLRRVFENMHEQDRLICPSQSVRILLNLLEEDTFENGAHVDYFDVHEKYADASFVGH